VAIRDVITIDEELCDGCGDCVSSCVEGAIQLVNGKAKLVSDTYCDGLGACLSHCPRGAITITRRESADFDERRRGTWTRCAAAAQSADADAAERGAGPQPRRLPDSLDVVRGPRPGARRLPRRHQPATGRQSTGVAHGSVLPRRRRCSRPTA
jgi:ferredoxin